ncbi:MAG: BON domain-containing protein [Pirellulaceae bacterium]
MRRLMIGLTLVCMAALIPLWVRADDRQIAQEIIQQLQQHKDTGKLKGFGIDLQVEKGIVVIEGRVSTAQQRQLTLDTVRRVTGVKQVVNKLTVTGKPFVQPQPAAQKPVAKSAYNATLAKLKGTLNRTAKATTNLTSTSSEKRAAEASLLAEQDQQLAKLVADGLKAEKAQGHLNGFRVNLSVDRGTVWLEGDVASSQQRAIVLDVARRIPGVKQVVNELAIREQTVPVVVAQATPVAEEPLPAVEANPVTKPIPVVTPIPVVAAEPVAKPLPEVKVAEPVPAITKLEPVIAQQPVGTAATEQPQALPAPATTHVAQLPAAAQPQVRYPVPMTYVAQMQPAYVPAHAASVPSPVARTRYDHPQMPAYAWPTYASHPNYAAVTYPKQYSPSAWPYIGPFYPYPQVPLGWRKVTLEWDDGWWNLDFKNR